jgi:hypothetical protein
MKPDAINKQIIFGSQRAGKTYTFDEKHDETLPAEMWFQKSDEGFVGRVVWGATCRQKYHRIMFPTNH